MRKGCWGSPEAVIIILPSLSGFSELVIVIAFEPYFTAKNVLRAGQCLFPISEKAPDNERESIDMHDLIPFLGRCVLDRFATGYPSLQTISKARHNCYPRATHVSKKYIQSPFFSDGSFTKCFDCVIVCRVRLHSRDLGDGGHGSARILTVVLT